MRPGKVIFTGGCSSGKSAALRYLLNRHSQVVGIPETASLLIKGGFPIPNSKFLKEIEVFQRINLELNRCLTTMAVLKNPTAKALVFDRSTLDGAAYWPRGIKNFFKSFKIKYSEELRNFDAVFYFRMPKRKYFEGKTETRFHSFKESSLIAKAQFEIYQNHRRFVEIPSFDNFEDKLAFVDQTFIDLLSSKTSIQFRKNNKMI